MKEVVGDRIFKLPKSVSNEIDPVTGRPCVFVQVNGKAYHIQVDVDTPIPYPAFCILRELGKIPNYNSFDEGADVLSL